MTTAPITINWHRLARPQTNFIGGVEVAEWGAAGNQPLNYARLTDGSVYVRPRFGPESHIWQRVLDA